MANFYNAAKAGIAAKTIDMDLDTFELALLRTTGPPVFNADDATMQAVLARAENTECSVASYNRQAVANIAITQDDTNDRALIDGDDVPFGALETGQTIKVGLLYKVVGVSGPAGDATHIPVAWFAIADTPTNGAAFTFQWNAAGMAALTGANFFNVGKKGIAEGSIDLDGDTFAALLLQSSGPPVFNPDDASVATVLGRAENTECTVASYARKTITSPAVTQDDANDRALWDADDIPWGALETGQTVSVLLVYKDGASDAARLPIAWFAFTAVPLNGSSFTTNWNAVGLARLS